MSANPNIVLLKLQLGLKLNVSDLVQTFSFNKPKLKNKID